MSALHYDRQSDDLMSAGMDTIYQTMLTSHPNLFSFVDELRPAKIVHISVPAAHLRAIVVVDNSGYGR